MRSEEEGAIPWATTSPAVTYLAYPLHHLREFGEFLYAVFALVDSSRYLSPDVNLVLLAFLASLSLCTLSSRLARLVVALFDALAVLSASRELQLALSL